MIRAFKLALGRRKGRQYCIVFIEKIKEVQRIYVSRLKSLWEGLSYDGSLNPEWQITSVMTVHL